MLGHYSLNPHTDNLNVERLNEECDRAVHLPAGAHFQVSMEEAEKLFGSRHEAVIQARAVRARATRTRIEQLERELALLKSEIGGSS